MRFSKKGLTSYLNLGEVILIRVILQLQRKQKLTLIMERGLKLLMKWKKIQKT